MPLGIVDRRDPLDPLQQEYQNYRDLMTETEQLELEMEQIMRRIGKYHDKITKYGWIQKWETQIRDLDARFRRLKMQYDDQVFGIQGFEEQHNLPQNSRFIMNDFDESVPLFENDRSQADEENELRLDLQDLSEEFVRFLNKAKAYDLETSRIRQKQYAANSHDALRQQRQMKIREGALYSYHQGLLKVARDMRQIQDELHIAPDQQHDYKRDIPLFQNLELDSKAVPSIISLLQTRVQQLEDMCSLYQFTKK